MSRVFPKLAKAITMAAKEGGSDPDMNPSLRTAIQDAKAQNMPKDNISSAIKRAEGKDAADYTEITYEGKGPHGVLVVVECATDNPTRTVANVRHYFTKVGGAMVPTGSLEFMFNRKAVFEFAKTEEMDLENFELEWIDSGLEEIEENDGTVYAYADYTDFGTLSSAIEAAGIETEKAGLERIATSPVDYSEEEIEDIEKMLDRLEEDEDVQAVFTNIS